MAILRYRFCDGKIAECEVSEEFAAEYAELEHKEKLTERKETRRHQSLDKSMEHGWDIADQSADVVLQAEAEEDKKRLYDAILKLPKEQRKLLEEVYFQDIPQTELAKRDGVTKTAVNNRLARILKKLKKYMG